MSLTITWIFTIAVGAVFVVLNGLRWLRVAQREHYIAPWTTRLGWLWMVRIPFNLVFLVAGIALLVLSFVTATPTFVASALVAFSGLPWGLGYRGTSAKLAWTDRLKRLAVVFGVLVVVFAGGLGLLIGPASIAIVMLLLAPIMDLALVILKPIEKRLTRKYLLSARKRLQQVAPRIVAITGSYGKTSTKAYVAHVIGGAFSTVASPASFNNLMGLSRAVNDRVVPGTEVFIAEMGVYGRGEIRELSESFPPDIAAITTIGEAHLARMGSRDVIFQAKSEITEKAKTVVLPIDDPLLSGLAAKCRGEGKRVITVSTVAGTDADVVVDAANEIVTVTQNGEQHSAPVVIPGVGHAVNLAVTVGIALALEIEFPVVAARLGALPDSAHRAEIQLAESGVAIVDDTYNSNPVGAARAVQGAAALAAERGGPLVVVTPGMVELGTVQRARNEEFAASVAEAGGYLFAVARTNRAALLAGAAKGIHPARTYDRRTDAVRAALDQAGDRGVILYENDLPDHYP